MKTFKQFILEAERRTISKDSIISPQELQNALVQQGQISKGTTLKLVPASATPVRPTTNSSTRRSSNNSTSQGQSANPLQQFINYMQNIRPIGDY